MGKRVQSPSSIGCYKQCPRKYYYQYIVKHPVKENIHLVRGKIVHSVLEQFYDVDLDNMNHNNYKKELTFFLKNLFAAHWQKKNTNLKKLGLTQDELLFYYEESAMMLANWANKLFLKIENIINNKNMNFVEAFNTVRPVTIEKHYIDKELGVRGFIDYIEHHEGQTRVMDFKTSKSDEIKEDQRLQLAIYALLYKLEHGKLPDKVGLYFLKFGERLLDVNEDLIKHALFEIEQIHTLTESDNIMDYPKKETGLCKYSTGQCDFFDVCRRDID